METNRDQAEEPAGLQPVHVGGKAAGASGGTGSTGWRTAREAGSKRLGCYEVGLCALLLFNGISGFSFFVAIIFSRPPGVGAPQDGRPPDVMRR